MKIVHILPSLTILDGGPQKCCFDMSRALAARGHEVVIHGTDAGMPADEGRAGDVIRRHGYRMHIHAARFPVALRHSPDMEAALDADIADADVVHIHMIYLDHGRIARKLCRKHGVPYVVQPHGAYDPFLYNRNRWKKLPFELLYHYAVMRDAADVLLTTAEEQALAAPRLKGKAGTVIPLGLWMDEYRPLPEPGLFRQAFPQVGDRRMITFLSRLNFKKGLDNLIPAFARLIRDGGRDDVHLVLAGPDYGFEAQCRAMVADAGIEDHVTFTGMLTGDMKLACLAEAEVFALPSWTENFGIAVIEALACGTPVVVSDAVNIWREIEGHGVGLVVKPDVGQTAEALARLLDENALRRNMAGKGPDVIEQHFAWDAIGAQMEAWYAQIAGQAPQ